MSDIRPGPVTRRLECYRLAVMVIAEKANQIYGWWDSLEGLAFDFHQRIYGGPLPPVEWVKQEEVTP